MFILFVPKKADETPSLTPSFKSFFVDLRFKFCLDKSLSTILIHIEKEFKKYFLKNF